MQYLSIRQTAEKWGISVRRIQILCKEKRIQGAIRIDYSWAIPANAVKPLDARIKNGKYMKNKANTETENKPIRCKITQSRYNSISASKGERDERKRS